MPYYHWYEFNHAMLSPFRAVADMTRLGLRNPFNPLAHTPLGRNLAASLELFERTTRRYGKPEWGIETIEVEGVPTRIGERILWSRPFCNLVHFEKETAGKDEAGPKVLLVAPMSGHYATLLRGTVAALLPGHDVHVTDWIDARMVPLSQGRFDLDDYIDYVIGMVHALGPDTHVIAVCQPSVPVLAAVAVMEEGNDPLAPRSMTLMGGPIDTRINPTAVNALAETRDLEWFRRNVIMKVPFPQPGFLRDVYPGFLQLSGFMSMNLDRHIVAHQEFFTHLVEGDGDSAEKHREFYDEYLAVMDLTAEFYLQTVDVVFIRHALPRGELKHRGRRVDTTKIRNTALLTVEGEKDDISGVGQTEAAHLICPNIADHKRCHYVQPGVGHYGVFNGRRFRAEIVPHITDFILENDQGAAKGKDRPHRTDDIIRPRGRPLRRPGEPVSGGEAVSGAATDRLARRRDGALGERAGKSVPAGGGDDLTRISGIGPAFADRLARRGITGLEQIAALDEAQAAALDRALGARGRVRRQEWVRQARKLLARESG